MNARRRRLLICAVLCWPLAACESVAENRTGAPATSPPPLGEPAPATLAEIAGAPGAWKGRRVQLSGDFAGWKGKCQGAPPVSRSDWMLTEGSVCIYVNGRLISELSAIAPERGIGRKVTVIGTVQVDQAGRAYIEQTSLGLK